MEFDSHNLSSDSWIPVFLKVCDYGVGTCRIIDHFTLRGIKEADNSYLEKSVELLND